MPYAKAIGGWKGLNRLDKMNSGFKVMPFLSSSTQQNNATPHGRWDFFFLWLSGPVLKFMNFHMTHTSAGVILHILAREVQAEEKALSWQNEYCLSFVARIWGVNCSDMIKLIKQKHDNEAICLLQWPSEDATIALIMSFWCLSSQKHYISRSPQMKLLLLCHG